MYRGSSDFAFAVYIGDASTLSILQLIRIIVENTAGSEMGHPFIDDPNRHRIMEPIIDFPENTRIPCPLPDEDTAGILIDSYFTNVSQVRPLSLWMAADSPSRPVVLSRFSISKNSSSRSICATRIRHHQTGTSYATCFWSSLLVCYWLLRHLAARKRQ
jgi:hypothetical protein